MIGFGSIGKGTLPLIERHFDYRQVALHRHRSRRRATASCSTSAASASSTRRSPRQLPRPADAAAHARRRPGLLRQSFGRHVLGRRSWSSAARSARSTSTPSSSRGWASTSTPRCGPEARSNYALRETVLAARRAQVRAARPRCPAAAPIPAWCPGSSSRRCSMSPRDLGAQAATSRRRARNGRRLRQTLGVKGIHIAERDTQRAKQPKPRGRLRQHLVGRRLPVGGHAAGRTRLGHP